MIRNYRVENMDCVFVRGVFKDILDHAEVRGPGNIFITYDMNCYRRLRTSPETFFVLHQSPFPQENKESFLQVIRLYYPVLRVERTTRSYIWTSKTTSPSWGGWIKAVNTRLFPHHSHSQSSSLVLSVTCFNLQKAKSKTGEVKIICSCGTDTHGGFCPDHWEEYSLFSALAGSE